MMMILRHGRTAFAQLVMALALLAAGTQACLPHGYMLGRDGVTGSFSVVFCTGRGATERWLDLDTGEIRDAPAALDTDMSGPDRSCAFAATSAALGILPVPPVLLRPQIETGPGLPPYGSHHAIRAFAARPPARAPPHTA